MPPSGYRQQLKQEFGMRFNLVSLSIISLERVNRIYLQRSQISTNHLHAPAVRIQTNQNNACICTVAKQTALFGRLLLLFSLPTFVT